MAKDAKGHGSEKRGANSVDATFSSKAGVGGLGKGMYARLASGEQYKLNAAATNGMVPRVGSEIDPSQHTRVGDSAPKVVPDKSVPGATHALVGGDGKVVARLYTQGSPAWREPNEGIKVIGGEGKVARIAQQHGIQGGPFKVQTLNTKLAGSPFQTQKSFRNNTVAEHVARGMRIDGNYTRVKVR